MVEFSFSPSQVHAVDVVKADCGIISSLHSALKRCGEGVGAMRKRSDGV